MEQVIIGVDPHKLSATIEVVDSHEKFLGSGRFSTDRTGYTAMRSYAKQWPDRVWAVEGASGAGRPLAQRLLEAGEQVVDVPAKLAARVRLFDTGHNRKTDAHDAHSIAVVAVRTTGLRMLQVDGELEALRMLTDRREALTRRRVQTVNRLQALLAELLPGQAKKDITALQAKRMLAGVRPRDIAGKTRRRIAAEELADLTSTDAKIKAATAELKAMVVARGSRLMELRGVGPVVAARTLSDVGHVTRFADRNRFASWTGTAPLDASSGEQNRHRLSRAGNRRVNYMIHIAAVTQICRVPGLMEALIQRRMRVMAAPRKYPEELRERAIRLAVDLRRDPATRSGALRRVGEQLGINPETLRNWVAQAEVDDGQRPGVTTADQQRIVELEREVRELRRTNEILRTASAFFAAAELDRKIK